MKSKPVAGYESLYLVTGDGRIWSRRRGRYLSPGVSRNGYLRITFWSDGNQKTVSVHRIVAEAFIGPCPDGYQVDHIDACKLNNRVENLEYVTGSENCRRAHRMGLCYKPRGRLTDDQVSYIRTCGKRDSELSIEFGMNRDTIKDARNGRTYKHVKTPPRLFRDRNTPRMGA